MTNELYKTTAFNASQAGSYIGQFIGDPRTYGLSVFGQLLVHQSIL